MPKRSRSAPDAVSAPDSRVIPIVEEQAVILKRKTLTEGVRVRTVVHEDEAVINEPVASETIEVERVPLDRWVEGPVPVRQEGDTTIVTLLEEVVVTEKRPAQRRRSASPSAGTSRKAPTPSRSAEKRP